MNTANLQLEALLIAIAAAETEVMPFSELAKMVGQTKGRYNNQE